MGAVVTTLHLGVMVMPYRAKFRAKKSGKVGKPVDTGMVAEFLEADYGIMQAFAREDVHGKDIVRAIEDSLESALKTLVTMQPGGFAPPWNAGMGDIESAFRDFIDSREAERVGIPGTPTKAALAGVNHRLKHPYRKTNPRRPSFRDTGMYVRSFRAWVD